MIASTQDILDDLRQGKMVILVDAEDRENEGDLLIASQFVAPEHINFMAREGRGLICLTLREDRCHRLGLHMMTSRNNSRYDTAFTVSIEAASGVSTGISAADRAKTIHAAIAHDADQHAVVQPGHIFPVRACEGGVLVRAGHTEAGCDLPELAGLFPSSVICEIMNADGSMARLPDLERFAQQHGLRIGSIADLIHHRSQHESLVRHRSRKLTHTASGTFTLHAFDDLIHHVTHYALVHGEIVADQETVVRVHEPTVVTDWIDPLSSKHSWPLLSALAYVQKQQAGVAVLLTHVGEHQQDQQERFHWDQKTFGVGAQILRALGVGRMCLLSRDVRLPSMVGFGLEITGCLSFEDVMPNHCDPLSLTARNEYIA